MKITGVLWDGCPTGDDCDRIYDTDGDDVLVRGRRLDDGHVRSLGLTMPEHEGLLLVPRRAVKGD